MYALPEFLMKLTDLTFAIALSRLMQGNERLIWRPQSWKPWRILPALPLQPDPAGPVGGLPQRKWTCRVSQF
jgi:hypothetical protein